MGKLLYIESSPRKDRSVSIMVAKAFLDAYQEANPDDEIDCWDLWQTPLPEFDGHTINAKYQILHGLEHTPEQAAAWQAVTDIFDRFKSADKYMLSLPMWNFGIPYKLKHFADVIVQPGLAFSFSEETGYTGLITGKPIVVVYARGGEYTSNSQVKSMDFQKPYIELLLGFVGFTDIRSIVAEPTLGDPQSVKNVKESRLAEAKQIGAKF